MEQARRGTQTEIRTRSAGGRFGFGGRLMTCGDAFLRLSVLRQVPVMASDNRAILQLLSYPNLPAWLRPRSTAIGGLNLGGPIDPAHHAVNVAELAIEKGATTLLMPVAARKQLNELPDDRLTKVNILYYTAAREALLKAMGE